MHNIDGLNYQIESKCCTYRYPSGGYGRFRIWKKHHDKLSELERMGRGLSACNQLSLTLEKYTEKMDGVRDVFEYPDCVLTPPVIAERVSCTISKIEPDPL